MRTRNTAKRCKTAGENFFSREKKFPPAPLSRKARLGDAELHVFSSQYKRQSRYTSSVLHGNMGASPVPPKVCELIAELERAGFVDRGGKGNRRDFVHPKCKRPLTISGQLGGDAKPYQIADVRKAIKEVQP